MKNIHILICGANIFGRMASTQRMKNLITPLLKQQKITVSNIVTNANEEEKDIFDFNIHFINIKYQISNIFSIIKYIYISYKFIKTNKKENSNNILYCYGYPDIENIWILLFAKWVGYKIVFDIVENNSFLNLSKSSRKHRLKIYTLLKMQKLIPRLGSVCFAISNHLMDYCNKICQNKISVIHLPICVDIQNILSFKNTISDNESIKIFYGGSFDFKDGVPLLLKAFELACKKNNNLELILTGKLYILDNFNELVNNSSAKEKIKFLGCLPTDEYFKTMVNSDILCMVRINSEFANAGFPYKLGEYLASGNSIIATNIGDISHYITNYKNALLIEPESITQICDSILLLAENSELRINLGKAAYETSLKYFSSENISDTLYLNLMNL